MGITATPLLLCCSCPVVLTNSGAFESRVVLADAILSGLLLGAGLIPNT